MLSLDFPGGSVVKNLPASVGDTGDSDSICVGKMPWRRKWQPSPVFLPGESHGERSLEGYSPCGHRVRHDWANEHAPIHVIIAIWHIQSAMRKQVTSTFSEFLFIYFQQCKVSGAALRLPLVSASRATASAGSDGDGFPCCRHGL